MILKDGGFQPPSPTSKIGFSVVRNQRYYGPTSRIGFLVDRNQRYYADAQGIGVNFRNSGKIQPL